MCYMGPREAAISYFKNIGYECPADTNPAECKCRIRVSTCFYLKNIMLL